MQTWWPKAALSAAAEPKIMLTAVTRDPSTLSLGLSLLLRLLPPPSLRKLPEPDERLPGCSNDAAATAAYRIHIRMLDYTTSVGHHCSHACVCLVVCNAYAKYGLLRSCGNTKQCSELWFPKK